MQNVILKDAKFYVRNFAGKEGRFNKEGDRYFLVFIDKEAAVEIEQEGWNVKWLDPREDGDEPQAYLKVAVSYKYRAPIIRAITQNNVTQLTEDLVSMVDEYDILTCDMEINPSKWDVNGKSGIKAYLKAMNVVVEEDSLAYEDYSYLWE